MPTLDQILESNIKDPSMLIDAKHLSEHKVPIYAKNIISALLKSYGLKDKSGLFTFSKEQSSSSSSLIEDRLLGHAGYQRNKGPFNRHDYSSSSSNNIGYNSDNNNNSSNSNNNNNNNNNNSSNDNRRIKKLSYVTQLCNSAIRY